jgi:hypothetical protein
VGLQCLFLLYTLVSVENYGKVANKIRINDEKPGW